MAGDWIKMRTDLYRDPKVCAIADELMDSDGELARYVSQNTQSDMSVTRNVMRNAAVGALLSVWGVMRIRGKRSGDDLVCRGVSLAVVDDIAELQGFGDAMRAVGWVYEQDGTLVFPRFFDEHNTDPAEAARQKNADRQRRFRKKMQAEIRNVTDNVTVTHREEKRREEKELMSGTPDDGPEAGDPPRPREVDPDSPAGLLAYLNEKTGRAYRAVDANVKPLAARLKTATPDEVRAVIDDRCAAWGRDERMAEYLRPATLFGAQKFEQYLGALNGSATRGDPDPEAWRKDPRFADVVVQ